MVTTVIGSFDVILNTPLDIYEGFVGRKAARKRVTMAVSVENQAFVGKVLARSEKHISVDVKTGGDMDAMQSDLAAIGTVTAMNNEVLQERLQVDRVFKAACLREGNGIMTGSDVANFAIPALMKLWGDEGTEEQRARRGDSLLEMMQSGQKAAVASQSERLASSSTTR